MHIQETPIFYDNTGKRWQKIVRALLVFLVMLIGASTWVLPMVSAPVLHDGSTHVATASDRTLSPTPEEITYSFADWEKIPIIGEGPLLRVIKVADRLGAIVAEDPFTGVTFHKLSAEERTATNGFAYAIERYGKTDGKRIALTFDDGPDPRYSPGILDILSREQAPSTFFVIGSNILRYPEITQRLIREGHLLGNHTFTHADIDLVGPNRAYEEVNATSRVIRSVTSSYTQYLRPPYVGVDDRSTRGGILSILRAQKLGYVVTGFTIDTKDWQFTQGLTPTLPPLSGQDEVVLLHDAGGNRLQTIEYLERFIAYAKAQGYSFVTLNALYPTTPALTGPADPTFADHATHWIAKSVLIVPQILMSYLFILTASIAIVTSVGFITLAMHYKRSMRKNGNQSYHPFVSVLVPAYNEEKVIAKTIESLLHSRYPAFEIIVIDDGSTDDTAQIAKGFSLTGRVHVITKENGGKASALNAGLEAALGEIIVTLDADTIFTCNTIRRLVHHFVDPSVGSVAGLVKVGNRINILTLWQALEYVSGIAIDRQAQGALGAIAIVPGACSAWRKSAIVAAGGHSAATLAEDCDLTLAIQKQGFKIMQEMRAVALTEAPQTLRALMKQRFRWTYGNMQALWKHRKMIGSRKHGFLGLFVMPFMVFTILVPLLFTPFTYIQVVGNLIAGDWLAAAIYFGLFTLVHLAVASYAVVVTREQLALLLLVPFYRLLYDPVRIYVLYASFKAALQGRRNGWGKLARTGMVPLGTRAVATA